MERQVKRIFREKDTYSAAEFARRLPCSVRQAYRLVDMGRSNGGIDSFRIGDRQGIRIPKAEVERFREARCSETLNNGMPPQAGRG